MHSVSYTSSYSETLRVGIIGFGSRGLGVLERIIALAKTKSERKVLVTLFDPNEPGIGLHSLYQPEYLLLNTVAHQISIFPEAGLSESNNKFPNFYTWCTQRNLKIGSDGMPCELGGRPVAPTDFLPRRLLGEYLSWSYEQVLQDLPSHIEVK
ncbi:MAG: FAD/NAD(P)-binding protein [Sneathiella sp.]|nr:FAD/NAD(P)-binding protein [Sneathiella sp.]